MPALFALARLLRLEARGSSPSPTSFIFCSTEAETVTALTWRRERCGCEVAGLAAVDSSHPGLGPRKPRAYESLIELEAALAVEPDPSRLNFEITETAAVANISDASALLTRHAYSTS